MKVIFVINCVFKDFVCLNVVNLFFFLIFFVIIDVNDL